MKKKNKIITLFMLLALMFVSTNIKAENSTYEKNTKNISITPRGPNDLTGYHPGGFVVIDHVNGTTSLFGTTYERVGNVTTLIEGATIKLYDSYLPDGSTITETMILNNQVPLIATTTTDANGRYEFTNIPTTVGLLRSFATYVEKDGFNPKLHPESTYAQAWTPITFTPSMGNEITFVEGEIPEALLTDGEFDPLKTLASITYPLNGATRSYTPSLSDIQSNNVDPMKAGTYELNFYRERIVTDYPSGTNMPAGIGNLKVVVKVLPKNIVQTTSTINVKYVDSTGKLLKKETLTGEIGTNYSTNTYKELKINNKTYVLIDTDLPQNGSGTYKDNNDDVVYKYKEKQSDNKLNKLTNNKKETNKDNTLDKVPTTGFKIDYGLASIILLIIGAGISIRHLIKK